METSLIRQVILSWIAQHDNGYVTDWNKGDRIADFKYLIKAFQKHKITEEEIKASTTLNDIIYHCTNPETKGNSLRAWQGIVKKQWQIAVYSIYPLEMPDRNEVIEDTVQKLDPSLPVPQEPEFVPPTREVLDREKLNLKTLDVQYDSEWDKILGADNE